MHPVTISTVPGASAFEWARKKGITHVKLGVYQPRVDGHTEQTITLETLEAFAVKLREKAERVEDAKAEQKTIPIEAWNRLYLNQSPNEEECAFCRAKPTCPSANKALSEFMMDGFDEIIEKKVLPPADTLVEKLTTMEQFDPQDDAAAQLLSKLMKLAPFVEDMITAVRAEVESRLLDSQVVPGFGLDTGRQGARKFKDAEEAEQLLNKQMRLSKDLIYNFKLKTPTQLEELTKPGENGEAPALGDTRWKRVCALVTRNDPKPTVKPANKIKNPYTPPKPTNEGFESVEDEDQLY